MVPGNGFIEGEACDFSFGRQFDGGAWRERGRKLSFKIAIEGCFCRVSSQGDQRRGEWRHDCGRGAAYPLVDESTNRKIVILALGANDGLRGFSVDEIRRNLELMIGVCRKNNARDFTCRNEGSAQLW